MAADYPKYVLNTLACLEVCKAHDGGSPRTLCLHNGQTIQSNAIAGKCPHPNGDQFLIQLKLPPPANRAPSGVIHAPPVTDFWSVAGPLLWKELHRWALTAHLINDNPGWLKNFTSKIACGDCKEHWIRWTAANPPDFTSHEKLFEWTWRAHEAVNSRLNKPAMPLDDARRIWTTAAVKPVIVTKGCGGWGVSTRPMSALLH